MIQQEINSEEVKNGNEINLENENSRTSSLISKEG